MTDEPQQFVDTGVGEPDHLQRLWTPYRMNYIVGAVDARDSAGSAGSAPAPSSQSSRRREDDDDIDVPGFLKE